MELWKWIAKRSVVVRGLGKKTKGCVSEAQGCFILGGEPILYATVMPDT